MTTEYSYRYREGIHGEHCIDQGCVEFVRYNTVGRAVTKEEAEGLVRLLNSAWRLRDVAVER